MYQTTQAHTRSGIAYWVRRSSSPFFSECTLLKNNPIFPEQRVGEQKHRYLSVAPYHKCAGMAHFETIFQDIIDSGGEGIILRNPGAAYEPGRSASYLKHKVLIVVPPEQHSFNLFFHSRNSGMLKQKLLEK